VSATKRRRKPDVKKRYLRLARTALRLIRIDVRTWMRTGRMIDGPTILALVEKGLGRE